ncbi:MAG: hypothetical protein ACJ0IB_05170 [Verrucomicrobiales bacterium]|nr:MAG: hypothetical protein DBX02_05080 [Verrucomicrobiota bacterium]|tara:strand:- start:924 stop:1337 length:414 start_codon:yes stop_codon:yes gene_type:complete
MISRIQKIKTLEEKITLLKKEAANDLRKKIKQKERELLKLGQEYIQTFQEDFNFEVRLKKNNIKPTSGSSSNRSRLTKEEKAKVETQIRKILLKGSISITEICAKTKRPINQIRNILKDIKGLKKKGAKRNTTYYLK